MLQCSDEIRDFLIELANGRDLETARAEYDDPNGDGNDEYIAWTTLKACELLSKLTLVDAVAC